MKNSVIFFALILLLTVIQACRKTETKPATSSDISPKVTTLAGKWYFVKDTVEAADFYTPFTFPQAYRLSNLNSMVFNADSTAVISDQVAHDALIMDYTKLYINPNEVAATLPFVFKYNWISADSTLALIKADGTTVSYTIKKLTADSLVLYTHTEIAKYPHDYRFAQYIHFSR
jgi:hypothetical protein